MLWLGPESLVVHPMEAQHRAVTLEQRSLAAAVDIPVEDNIMENMPQTCILVGENTE